MAHASHGMDATAQDTASRTLTTSTEAGVAARDMGAIAPRAAPVVVISVTAGIAVSIQIMAPAIRVWKRAGGLGRSRPGGPPRRRPALAAVPPASSAIPSPMTASPSPQVRAGLPADVWAVGGGGGGGRTLIEHWNGTSWSHVLAPAPGQSSFLLGVTAISANDAWAPHLLR